MYAALVEGVGQAAVASDNPAFDRFAGDLPAFIVVAHEIVAQNRIAA